MIEMRNVVPGDENDEVDPRLVDAWERKVLREVVVKGWDGDGSEKGGNPPGWLKIIGVYFIGFKFQNTPHSRNLPLIYVLSWYSLSAPISLPHQYPLAFTFFFSHPALVHILPGFPNSSSVHHQPAHGLVSY